MSLNCMNCNLRNRAQSKTDTNTGFLDKTEKPKHRHNEHRKVHRNLRSIVYTKRNWSGNLIPSAYYKTDDESTECGSPKKKAKRAHHRRFGSTGSEPSVPEDDFIREPKLVRSGGLRRDWSFENLDSPRRDGKRKQRA